MKIIKILINGRPQGVYGITEKDEVTDFLLDEMNNGNTSKEWTKTLIEEHLKNGFAIIPKDSKLFEWDENIHGKFFT